MPRRHLWLPAALACVAFAPSTIAAAHATDLLAHRALYDLKLDATKHGDVQAAAGHGNETAARRIILGDATRLGGRVDGSDRHQGDDHQNGDHEQSHPRPSTRRLCRDRSFN